MEDMQDGADFKIAIDSILQYSDNIEPLVSGQKTLEGSRQISSRKENQLLVPGSSVTISLECSECHSKNSLEWRIVSDSIQQCIDCYLKNTGIRLRLQEGIAISDYCSSCHASTSLAWYTDKLGGSNCAHCYQQARHKKPSRMKTELLAQIKVNTEHFFCISCNKFPMKVHSSLMLASREGFCICLACRDKYKKTEVYRTGRGKFSVRACFKCHSIFPPFSGWNRREKQICCDACLCISRDSFILPNIVHFEERSAKDRLKSPLYLIIQAMSMQV